MKNLLSILCLFLVANFVQAQTNVIDRYFANYESDDSFTKLKVSEKSFELFSQIETKDAQEQEVIASIKKLKGIKGLFKENGEDGLSVYKTGLDKIKNSGEYEDLVSFSNPEHNGIFMIREDAEVIKELTVMYGSQNDFGLVTIYGEIDVRRIKDLAEVIQKNGQEWFATFDNIAKDEIVFDSNASQMESRKNSFFDAELQLNIYPNPAVDFVNLEAVKGGDDFYELTFYSLLGEPIQQVGQVNLPYKLALKDVPAGSYFIRITNAKGAFKNYKIVKR